MPSKETALVYRLTAKTEDLERKLDRAKKKLGRFDKQSKGISTKIAGTLGGLFAVGAVVSFGKSIVDTTAKFQKMEAVLSNTLGAGSLAKKAMDDIVEFASKTPFAVDGLTGAFVKLANQGFVPTSTEMRKLGDLAASTGKDFDQLAEAVIDAQVGEFERLKEFGIRSQKQGDRVKFTFKGVTKEVQFTEKAIQGYLLSLGDAKGVSGAMAKISETVGGKISNLGDNFTQLQKTIGDSSTGLIAGILDLANNALSDLNKGLETSNKLTDSGASFWDKLGIAFNVYFGQYSKAAGKVYDITKQKTAIDALVAEIDKRKQAAEAIREQIRAFDELKRKSAFTVAPALESLGRSSIGPPTESNDAYLPSFINPYKEKMNPEFEEFREYMMTKAQEVQNIINDTLGQAFFNAFDALGRGEGIRGMFQGLFTALGDGLQRLGLLVKPVATAMNALKASIAELNGPKAFVAAAAFIAAGAALKQGAASIAGSIGGGGGGFSGGGSGGSFNQNIKQQSIKIEQSGEFKIRGRDLVYSMNEQNKLNNRLRG